MKIVFEFAVPFWVTMLKARRFRFRCRVVEAPIQCTFKCDQCDCQMYCEQLHGVRGDTCKAYPKIYKRRVAAEKEATSE